MKDLVAALLVVPAERTKANEPSDCKSGCWRVGRGRIVEQRRTGFRSERNACPTCGAIFLQSAGLKYRMEHKVCESKRPTARLKFRCDLCSKEFAGPDSLTYVCIAQGCAHLTENWLGFAEIMNGTTKPACMQYTFMQYECNRLPTMRLCWGDP